MKRPSSPRGTRSLLPWPARVLSWLLAGCALGGVPSAASAQALPEYRLKAVVLYNFALYTEWPKEVGAQLNLCTYGQDLFGDELDAIQAKTIGGRRIVVQRGVGRGSLAECNVLFIAPSALPGLSRMLDGLRDSAVLTVTDSVEPARSSVALNIALSESRLSFQVNLKALSPRLSLSSKLLRLATEVNP